MIDDISAVVEAGCVLIFKNEDVLTGAVWDARWAIVGFVKCLAVKSVAR